MGSVMVSLFALVASQQSGFDRQEPARPKGIPGRPASWAFEGRAEAELRYDSNVWLLDGGQQDRLDQDRPSDRVSGRFDDMGSVDDFLLIPELRLEAKGPSPLGRRLDAYLDLEYSFYTQNPRRSHLELAAGILQGIGARGHLELSLKYLPEYFRKNYLADAVDAGGNGNIGSAERIYEDGTCREGQLELAYRHKLVDRTPQQPFGLFGDVSLGLRDRAYDSPFDNRDEEALFAGFGLRFAYGPKVRWGIRYRYETIGTPGDPEVVLIDEVALGRDVNGDGIPAGNARTVTAVDRSRIEQTFGLSFGVQVTAAVEGQISYARVLRDFDSGEPLDVGHSGREDIRDEVEMGLRIVLNRSWGARLGWQWREQHTDRPDDPGGSGETVDYKRHLFFISAVYHW